MSNYIEKYLKYKSKYLQLKIQKGGANLGDHTYIKETNKYFGVIVGYNSSVDQYVVLQNSIIQRFLKAKDENSIWKVDNSQRQSNPSDSDIKIFIDNNRCWSDVVWFIPGEVTQPKISRRDMTAPVSHRDMAAPVSSFPSRCIVAPVRSTLIELARTNTKFQDFIFQLKFSEDITRELLIESITFLDLLTDDAFREMHQYIFKKRGNPEWMRVGIEVYKQSTLDTLDNRQSALKIGLRPESWYCSDCVNQVLMATRCTVTGGYHIGNIEAYKRPTLDNDSANALIKEVSSRLGMSMYCSDCGKQVNSGTKCTVVPEKYHMGRN